MIYFFPVLNNDFYEAALDTICKCGCGDHSADYKAGFKAGIAEDMMNP